MFIEAQRIEQRTNFDLEMMQELGYCQGIENYSRHLSGRAEGQRPYTLLDYFPEQFLMFIDESHVTLPQVRGMFAGDRSRKETLVDFGFRLSSALDNRPLFYDEFEYAGMINTYSKYFRENISYCSDSNGYWRHDRLDDFLKEGHKRIQVLTHPVWWWDMELQPRQKIEMLIKKREKYLVKWYDQILDEFRRENIGK